jgi:glycosyltransferase involved in cell wall biosynthesis
MKFSIVIPTYNRSTLVIATINSALKQEYDDFEVLVIDDGSTDDTREVVSSIRHPKLFYHYKQNEERGVARNFGAKQATGEYVVFLDSDDLIHPNHLSEAAKLIHDHPNAPWLYLRSRIVNQAGTVLGYSDSPQKKLMPKLLYGNCLLIQGLFIQRAIALSLPFTPVRAAAGSEDWLLWIQLATRYKLVFSNTFTSTVLQHDNRSVVTNNPESILNRIEPMADVLVKDNIFMQRFGNRGVNSLRAHMHSYAALMFALRGQKLEALNHLRICAALDAKQFFVRRTLGIIKNVLTTKGRA